MTSRIKSTLVSSTIDRSYEINEYDASTIFSKAVFAWVNPILDIGTCKKIELTDLTSVSKEDDSFILSKQFQHHWNNELKCSKNPSLLRTIFRMFGPTNYILGFIIIVESCIRIYQAVLLGDLVAYFLSDGNNSIQNMYMNGYIVSMQLVLTGIVIAFMHHHFFFYAWRLGLQLRITVSTCIYEKALKLHMSALSKTAIGHIVNLCTQDTEAFQQAGCFFHFCYAPILESIGCLVVGIQILGYSFLSGYCAILLLVPLQSVFSHYLSKARKTTAKCTDDRLKYINQALSGARLMKINAWEGLFTDLIEVCRKKEISALLQTNVLRAINEAIFFVSPCIVGSLSFITYSRTGGTLTQQKVFTVLSLFNIMQFSMTKFFPYSIQFGSEAMVAVGRIQKLLLLEEVSDKDHGVGSGTKEGDAIDVDVDTTVGAVLDDSDAIVLKAFCASWNNNKGKRISTPPDAESATSAATDTVVVTDTATTAGNAVTSAASDDATLSNINLTVKTGELLMVIGAVGSSKSSLLYAILEELSPNSGSIAFSSKHSKKPSIAYCSQEPFIISNTIRENILFGKQFNKSRYEDVVKASELLSDFKILPQSDHTVIGDRGINLSGGQRARISLARALYSDADIYLFDDPLSAVDSKVSKNIFEHAICGSILQAKTRILATHQIQYLSSSKINQILVLNGGRVSDIGTYNDLLAKGSLNWINFMYTKNSDSSSSSDSSSGGDSSSSGGQRDRNKSIDDDGKFNSDAATAEHTNSISITAVEDREDGTVKSDTYMDYFRHMGGIQISVLLGMVMMIGQALTVGTNIWLSQWSHLSYQEQQLSTNLNIYVLLVILSIAFSFIRSISFFIYAVLAAQGLHNSMLRSIVRATINFYDANPIGRILNRFGKDVGSTDDNLPMTLYDFVQCVLMVLAAVIVVCIGSPYIAIILVPLLYYFSLLRSRYIKTSREIKRIEAITRSPVFSHLSESIDGLITVRAYDRASDFLSTCKTNINNNSRAYFGFVASSRWLGFRLDFMVVILLAACTFGAVAAKESKAIVDPSVLIVGVLYVIQLSGLFQWTVRLSAEVENMMVSVERIVSYSKTPSEPPLYSSPPVVDSEWPARGDINVSKLVCSYRSDLKPVIDDCTFNIKSNSRIAIVGRTGSGKSTLVNTLLRLVDIVSGSITIDNIDITTVGLHELRSKISVIPQSPFLFYGTVRSNLDPFNQYTDSAILSAIDSVNIRHIIVKLGDDMLLNMITENGSNLSVGERQVLCLVRCILSRNKILIMDEATANIDMETDAMIQTAIRKEFKDSTVISIAHRLSTIIDNDAVIVMHEGRIVEMDHPFNLLSKYFGDIHADTDMSSESMHQRCANVPKNTFASMVYETGDNMATHLCKEAVKSFQSQVR